MNTLKALSTLALYFLLPGCIKDKTINDVKDVCTADCTVIKGRILTEGNKPVPGVKLTFIHETVSGPGCIFCPKTTRIIKKGITNDAGDYRMEFHLEDSEVIPRGSGYFELTMDTRSVDGGKYIVGSDYEFTDVMYEINRRDTIIDKPIYLPEKTYVKVNLKGFKKAVDGDWFEVQSFFSSGFKIDNAIDTNTYVGGIYGTGASPYGAYVASSENYAAKVMVAKNDSTILRVSRVKNGQGMLFEEKKIFATGNNNIEVTFNY